MGDSDYKFFGLLAVGILTVGLSFVVVKWPKSRHFTVSQHVAVSKRSIIYYVALFTLVLSLLILFFLPWFVPEFEAIVWFSVLIIASCVAQLACTLIPETGGQSDYHRVLAGISAILLVPALTLLLFSPLIDSLNKILITLGILTMLVVIFTVAVQKGNPRNFLILQSCTL
jgi:hypothetical protein